MPSYHLTFETGPESMLRSVLIQDAIGNLLESMENYIDLYYLTELLTNNKNNKAGSGVTMMKDWYYQIAIPATGTFTKNAIYRSCNN